MSLEREVRELLDAGDPAGAATLALTSLGPSVLRYLTTLLHDEQDAGDAFSIFAEHLWQGLPAFGGRSSLRTWAFRIAWNAAYNLRNEAWRRRFRPLLPGEASALVEELRTRSVVRVARQEDSLQELRKSLTPEEQSLLALRLDQEFTWEEISQILAAEGPMLSVAALMKRFERLKARMAELARERGMLD